MPSGGAVYLLAEGTRATIGSLDRSADATVRAGTADDGFPASVEGCADVDGDGLDDLLLGARGAEGSVPSAGAAHLFTSEPSGAVDATDAEVTLLGVGTSDLTGAAVDCGGDADGDGYADLLVGAPGAADGAGRVYLAHGLPADELSLSAADAVFSGGAGDSAGASVRLVPGLLSTDAAVVVGAPAGGAVYVLDAHAGAMDLADADVIYTAVGLTDRAGTTLDHGDLDDDGWADLVVGAPGADTSTSGVEGVVYVLYGPLASGSLAGAGARIESTAACRGVGAAVAVVPNTFGSSYAGLLLGAPDSDAVAWFSGGPR